MIGGCLYGQGGANEYSILQSKTKNDMIVMILIHINYKKQSCNGQFLAELAIKMHRTCIPANMLQFQLEPAKTNYCQV